MTTEQRAGQAVSGEARKSLADCARSWLAESRCTDPREVAEFASGWTWKSWEVVARREGFYRTPTGRDIDAALDELMEARGVR